MNMYKRLIVFILAVILGITWADDCKAQYDYLKFGDFGVTSVSPLSFTSVRGEVWVDVENPQAGFSVTEVYGKLYCDGRALIEGKADDYYVPNGSGRLNLTGVASLCPGVSIFDVLGLILFDPQMYTVDIKAVITDDGAAPVVKEVKNIPVLTLLKKDEQQIQLNNESTDSK
jgi:hypothetical protein